MNKLDDFINSNFFLETEKISEITVVDNQINELSKQLNDSIENFVNAFIVKDLPSDSFLEAFIKAVNTGFLGNIQKQNAKIILSLALGKYLIKKSGIIPNSELYKIIANSDVIYAIAKAISQAN